MNNILQSTNTLLFGFIAALLLIQYNEHQTQPLSVGACPHPPHEFPSPASLGYVHTLESFNAFVNMYMLTYANQKLSPLEAQ